MDIQPLIENTRLVFRASHGFAISLTQASDIRWLPIFAVFCFLGQFFREIMISEFGS